MYKFFDKTKNQIIELYHNKFEEYFALMPFLMALGIILFTALDKAKIPNIIIIAIVLFSISAYLLSNYFIKIILMQILMIIAGICISCVHTNFANINNICFFSKNVPIEAKIERIVYGEKIYVFGKLIKINNKKSNCNVKIRNLYNTTFDSKSIVAGDIISFVGSVYKKSNSIYQTKNKDLIDKIDGQQFISKAIRNVNIIKQCDLCIFSKIRANIANKISTLKEKTKKSGYGIIAALTIGNTGYIDEESLDAIRKSGFAHLLAISGLHLGIIIATIFVLIRSFLSLFPYICLRYNTKKISALIAVLVSFMYLQITNESISVQRSFIMCGFLLVGIITDRKAIMLRIWSIAFFYILIFMPSKIFIPSMQMSFIATFSLITVYQKIANKDDIFFFKKDSIFFYIITIFLSSFVACIATMFFEIYHFNQLSIIGIISNELAIPITEFLLLPLSMISVIFGETQFGNLIYFISGYLGDILIWIAKIFSSFKFSYFLLKEMSAMSILSIASGLYLIFLTLNKWSLLGIILVFIGLINYYFSPKPVFFVEYNSKQIVYLGNDDVYYVNKPIKSDFLKNILSQKFAQKDFFVENESKVFSCNNDLCEYTGKKNVCFIFGKKHNDKKCIEIFKNNIKKHGYISIFG